MTDHVFGVESNRFDPWTTQFLISRTESFVKLIPSEAPPTVFVCVVVLVLNTLPLLLALRSRGHTVLVIPKTSTTNHANLTLFFKCDMRIYKMDSGALDMAVPCLQGLSRGVKERLIAADAKEISDVCEAILQIRGGAEHVAILDVGGYFHQALWPLQGQLRVCNLSLSVVVEDTENGHMKYSSCNALPPVQVLSVARSVCKEAEDEAVGNSIVVATDTAIRDQWNMCLHQHELVQSRIAVIGFGKIGRGIVQTLVRYGCRGIIVIEKNPQLISRVIVDYPSSSLVTPLCHNFSEVGEVPHPIRSCLEQVKLVFSATGSRALGARHLELLRDLCALSACTSRDDEFGFDFGELERLPKQRRLQPYRIAGKTLYFTDDGNAPNMACGWGVNNCTIAYVQQAIVITAFAVIVRAPEQVTLNVRDIGSFDASIEEQVMMAALQPPDSSVLAPVAAGGVDPPLDGSSSRNVEIKARVADVAALETAAARLSGSDGIVLHQHDVFFQSPSGRLKLRVVNGTGQLIYYERADDARPKLSTFSIAPCPNYGAVRVTLGLAFGELSEVKKKRKLFLVGQTRVHVDMVEGLGGFVELEVCMNEGQSVLDAQAVAWEILKNLGISEADLVEGAYTDLLRQQSRL
jgi:adenylate cyclase class IV/S-adenosylhomocysteine hydrolase